MKQEIVNRSVESQTSNSEQGPSSGSNAKDPPVNSPNPGRAAEIEAKQARIDADPSLESSVSVPEKLMSMYLAGRLAQSDLVYKLKSYNMVTADNIIRESKHSPTRAIDYNDVPKATVDPITHEADKPLPGTRGTKSEKDMGKGLEQARDEHTEEQERKQEEEEKQIQKEERLQVTVQNEIVEDQNRQAIESHQLQERIRKEEMEKDGEASVSNSLVEEGGIGEKTKKGTLDAAMKRTKGAKHYEREKKLHDLMLQSTTVARADRSSKKRRSKDGEIDEGVEEEEDDNLNKDELLEELFDEWELFKK
jgi:hypothetical protein